MGIFSKPKSDLSRNKFLIFKEYSRILRKPQEDKHALHQRRKMKSLGNECTKTFSISWNISERPNAQICYNTDYYCESCENLLFWILLKVLYNEFRVQQNWLDVFVESILFLAIEVFQDLDMLIDFLDCLKVIF